MEEIFKQYATPIIIAIVVVAIIAIVGWLLNGNNSPVADSFHSMLDSFMAKANLGS